MVAALDSERYFALLEALEAPGRARRRASLAEIRAAEHRRLRKAVRALGRGSAGRRAARGADQRKAGRYAASSRSARAYVKAAKALQDVLGEHQDAVVAEERLRELVRRCRNRARRRAAGRARTGPGPAGPRRVGVRVETAREGGVDEIRAAGGIILRDGRIVVVHRPEYDDWTLPKGKAIRARATRTVRYARSRRKPACGASSARSCRHRAPGHERAAQARALSLMRPRGRGVRAQDEIDEVRWVPLVEAESCSRTSATSSYGTRSY